MQWLIHIFGTKGIFKDEAVIGLSGLRKSREYVKITVPDSYKKTYLPNVERNYLLIT